MFIFISASIDAIVQQQQGIESLCFISFAVSIKKHTNFV